MLDRSLLLYVACILAGLALIKVSVSGTFLVSLGATFHIIGLLAVLVFSIVILVYGVLALFKQF